MAAAQEQFRVDFLAFVDAHDDAVWRGCPPGHITASALVVDPTGERVLLTLHPKVGRWLQMGGHCEPSDVTLADAALREATEESGIAGLTLIGAEPVQLDLHPVRCRPDGETLHHDVQYVAVAPALSAERISRESLELEWFPWDALPVNTDESVRRLVDRARLLVSAAAH